MTINKKYVVYELNNIMGNEQYKSLSKVRFDGWQRNSFETEEEAVQALIDDNRVFENFVILREVYITDLI